MSIIFLKPELKHNIWGGSKLREEFAYEVEGNDIGECWGISAHSNGDCVVKNGEYAGKTLSLLWKEHAELFGKTKEETKEIVFPLLIKIIDAKDDLSIQVHPDDSYAKINEKGSLGKTECWYILDCEENSSLVVGHNAKNKDEVREMILEGRWSDFIQTIPVKKGDFIQIDPGTVHAIKGGITLLETQQNSDITYRVYDYDRLSDGKPRELHVEKSIDVITAPAKSSQEAIQELGNLESNVFTKLYGCQYYQVYKLNVQEDFTMEQSYPYLLMSVVEGEGTICGFNIKKGDHFIVPNNFGTIKFEGNMEIMASTE